MLHRAGRTMIAALFLATTAATVAVAADRFDVIGVENGTKAVIRIQHRWGREQWKSDTRRSGQWNWFRWEFKRANVDRTPRFHVKFNSDLSPGTFWEDYDLQYQAPDHEWQGPQLHLYSKI
jgi:hypothetical protein